MKSFNFLLALIIFSTAIYSCRQKQDQSSNTDYIDTDIGGVGFLLQPTRPTVQLPNQMVRMYPIRKDYLDDQISWFPMSTISHRQGELFGIKPVNGKVSDEKWDYKLAYDHDLEVKKPWFYSAWLLDDEIQVDYAPGAKSGMYRFHFEGDDFSLLFKSLQSGEFSMKDGAVLEGIEEFQGMKAYVYGLFDQKGSTNSDFEGSLNSDSRIGRASIHSSNSGVQSISFKYGFSFISVEKAKENLEREIPSWDFEGLKAKGLHAWKNRIDQVKVKGGTIAQRRTFYTSLYRTYERMIDINEVGQYYSAYDHKVHESDHPFFVDDWVWD
ncbi:MAG: glycoside hydrolase family 92 protein, partial [Cyclobacteriaceae bacterium]|nr:glycoside hydrolase family 92 protein [Cyclobacteriaceae bacterium]